MAIIRIVNGTYGYRPNGSPHVIMPVSAGDPPISVDDAKATELVKSGVAVYVETPITQEAAPAAPVAAPFSDDGEPEPDSDDATGAVATADMAPVEYSTKMRADDLRAAMREQGIPVKIGMTKQDMVDALNAAPDLSAEDVVE